MKKVLLFLGLLAASIALIACGDTSVEANISDSFEIISKDEIGRAIVYKIKHKDTGCYYLLSGTSYTASTSGQEITQMFVKEDNVSLPYCE